MDTGAVTVLEGCSATQCFELFMKLGLCHLPVLRSAPSRLRGRSSPSKDFYVESIADEHAV